MPASFTGGFCVILSVLLALVFDSFKSQATDDALQDQVRQQKCLVDSYRVLAQTLHSELDMKTVRDCIRSMRPEIDDEEIIFLLSDFLVFKRWLAGLGSHIIPAETAFFAVIRAA